MTCGRDSKDPIVQKLYGDDDLMLLKRGFSPKTFKVGQVLTKLPRNSSFLVEADTMFAPWAALEAERSKYVRLSARDWSDKIAADAGVELAATLGGESGEDVAAEAKAAFNAAGAKNFRVALANAWLTEISPGDVHQRLQRCDLMPIAIDYLDRGATLFFISAVLTVTSARIELGASANVDGSSDLALGWLEKLSLKGKLESAQTRTYVLEPTGEKETVIAFRCLELSFDQGRYLMFARPDRPVAHRQLDAHPATDLAAVSDEDSAFVEVTVASR